jgi:predicted glycosyltransferase involved in capsule biosynthesis
MNTGNMENTNQFKKYKISFLTASMNRCFHLKKTYIENMHQSLPLSNCDVEFLLLNYNSNDEINDFVETECKNLPVEFKYIQVSSPTTFHMSRAKNILGRYATGNLLCWLDADNQTKNGFIEFVCESMKKNENSIFYVEYSQQTSGMCGRICCNSEHFQLVRGYDEQMLGWGYEEADFVARCVSKFNCERINIPIEFLNKIDHSDDVRFLNYSNEHKILLPKDHRCSAMKSKSNYDNFQRSLSNIKNKNLIANVNTNWGVA